MNKCVPLKRRRKGMRPWWMTRKVMRLIRKKRRLWRFYTTDPRARKDFNQFEAYIRVQKEVQAAVKNAKKNYEKKLAKDCKKNPKVFWSYMKKKTSNRVFTLFDISIAWLISFYFRSDGWVCMNI